MIALNIILLALNLLTYHMIVDLGTRVLRFYLNYADSQAKLKISLIIRRKIIYPRP